MEFNGWEFIKKAYTGNIRGSYWYLYLYLAYLCLLPVLRNVAALMGKRLFFYIIIISTLVDTLGLIAYQSPDLYSSFYGYVSCVNGYAFLYPLLGFGSYNYLKHKEMGKKEYIFFIFVFLSTVCLCSWLVYNEYMVKGEYSEAHIWRFTALLSVSAYILIYDIVRRIEVPIVIKHMLAIVSNSCFGIYLCENLLEVYTIKIYYIFYNLCGMQLVSCCIYIIGTIIVGTAIFSVIKKIPIITNFI